MPYFANASGVTVNGGKFQDIAGDNISIDNSARTYITDSYNTRNTHYTDSFNDNSRHSSIRDSYNTSNASYNNSFNDNSHRTEIRDSYNTANNAYNDSFNDNSSWNGPRYSRSSSPSGHGGRAPSSYQTAPGDMEGYSHGFPFSDSDGSWPPIPPHATGRQQHRQQHSSQWPPQPPHLSGHHQSQPYYEPDDHLPPQGRPSRSRPASQQRPPVPHPTSQPPQSNPPRGPDNWSHSPDPAHLNVPENAFQRKLNKVGQKVADVNAIHASKSEPELVTSDSYNATHTTYHNAHNDNSTTTHMIYADPRPDSSYRPGPRLETNPFAHFRPAPTEATPPPSVRVEQENRAYRESYPEEIHVLRQEASSRASNSRSRQEPSSNAASARNSPVIRQEIFSGASNTTSLRESPVLRQGFPSNASSSRVRQNLSSNDDDPRDNGQYLSDGDAVLIQVEDGQTISRQRDSDGIRVKPQEETYFNSDAYLDTRGTARSRPPSVHSPVRHDSDGGLSYVSAENVPPMASQTSLLDNHHDRGSRSNLNAPSNNRQAADTNQNTVRTASSPIPPPEDIRPTPVAVATSTPQAAASPPPQPLDRDATVSNEISASATSGVLEGMFSDLGINPGSESDKASLKSHSPVPSRTDLASGTKPGKEKKRNVWKKMLHRKSKSKSDVQA